MMTANHLTENMAHSITETIIAQLLNNLTHTEQTNNLHLNFSPSDSMPLNQSDRQSVPKQYSVRREKNPCDHNGVQLRCLVCESIYHIPQNCPETKSQDTFKASFSHEKLFSLRQIMTIRPS